MGQEVEVKLQAYDFTPYGAIPGRLEHISATTFTTPTGEAYYKGSIRLQRNHVGETPGIGMVMPGMLVEVSVNTGERTLLHYMLRPAYEAMVQTLTQAGSAMYEQGAAEGAEASSNGAEPGAASGDEETVDAEFREVGGQG